MPNARNYQGLCVVCGGSFAAYQPGSKYCSPACQAATRRTKFELRDCAICEQSFMPRQANALYCGDECKRTANRLKHRRRSRSYVARHPDRRTDTQRRAWEKLRADPARYAKFLQQGRESYARNPLTSYLYALNWRGQNRERVRAINRRASGRRYARAGATPAEVAEYALVLRQDPCSYCGGPGGVIDHIVALAEGGEHACDNLTGACHSCNARKRVRPLLVFMAKAAQAAAVKAA